VYPWHSAFDTEIDVAYEERRRGERVYVCVLANDSGVVIPAWMFDPAACAGLKLGAPRVCVAALDRRRRARVFA
jgi:hypothetical protein